MKRQRFIQNALIIVLGISIIFMSIGYAAFGEGFEINGKTPIESKYWDVHFENITSTNNTIVSDFERITPAKANYDTTSLMFAITLKPGEVYEINATVRNGGTYNAKLRDIDFIAKSNFNEENKNIKYSVTYDDDSEITKGDILNSGAYKKMIIRVEYLASDNNLEEESASYTFNLNMDYIQA